MASDEFNDAFSCKVACNRYLCRCGRTYFDTYNEWDWEDGELEELEELSKTDDNLFPIGHSVEVVRIDLVGNIVLGCECNGFDMFEKVLIKNSKKILSFFKKRSDKIKEELDVLEMAKEI